MSLSKIISILAHPIFIPVYSLFLIYNSGSYFQFTPLAIQRLTYMVIIVSTILLPLSILPLLKFNNVISNYSLNEHRERFYPLFFSFLFYGFGYYLLFRLPLNSLILRLQFAAMLSLFVAMIISLKWKISLHLLGMGGILGLIIGINLKFVADLKLIFVITTILAALLAYSRLKLNKHTPAQVYVAFIIGLSISLIAILLL